MAVSESGHARNIGNFELLITECESFGTDYNPGNAALTIPNMRAKLAEAEQEMSELNDKNIKLGLVINRRRVAFKTMKKFSTRVKHAIKSFGVDALTIAKFDEALRKLRGVRSPRGTRLKRAVERARNNAQTSGEDGNPSPSIDVNLRFISVSQQSYAQMTNHYDKLVKVVLNLDNYTPNEPELTKTGVQTVHTELVALNSETRELAATVKQGRHLRDTKLYREEGIVPIAEMAKNYVLSKFGAGSPQHRRVSKIKFRRPRLIY